MSNKIIKVQTLARNKKWNGGCFENFCCSCNVKKVFFKYCAGCGSDEDYQVVPSGTVGALEGVEMWDANKQNLYLVNASDVAIIEACNNCVGGACYDIPVLNAVIPACSTTLTEYCIVRTKATSGSTGTYTMQLDYMEYGQGTIFQETDTVIKLGLKSATAPIPNGTDVVTAGACAC